MSGSSGSSPGCEPIRTDPASTVYVGCRSIWTYANLRKHTTERVSGRTRGADEAHDMSMQQRRRRAAASLRPSTAYNVPTARVFHQGTVQLRVCRVCGVCDGGVWSEGLSVPIVYRNRRGRSQRQRRQLEKKMNKTVLPLHESAQPGSRQTEFFNDTIATRVRKVSVVVIGHRSLSNTTVALGYCWPRILLLAPRFCLVYSALSPRMCPMARIATSPAT